MKKFVTVGDKTIQIDKILYICKEPIKEQYYMTINRIFYFDDEYSGYMNSYVHPRIMLPVSKDAYYEISYCKDNYNKLHVIYRTYDGRTERVLKEDELGIIKCYLNEKADIVGYKVKLVCDGGVELSFNNLSDYKLAEIENAMKEEPKQENNVTFVFKEESKKDADSQKFEKMLNKMGYFKKDSH